MIHLVTDSTSDLVAARAIELGVTVVPLIVRFGDEEFRDGIDLTAAGFYARLGDSSVNPTTSQPSPQAFAETYRPLLKKPGDHIVSVHISQKLSGTLQSATLGSREGDESRVHVVDSGTVSAGLQLVLAAARRDIDSGASLAAVLGGIGRRSLRTRIYVLLDTLTYLQRGGRIGRAQALLGGMLKVKPLLRVAGGEVHPESKVRSRRQGIEAIVDLVRAAGDPEAIAVMHGGAPDNGAELRDRLGTEFPELESTLGELGPVVGTYTGPGAVGVAVMSSG